MQPSAFPTQPARLTSAQSGRAAQRTQPYYLRVASQRRRPGSRGKPYCCGSCATGPPSTRPPTCTPPTETLWPPQAPLATRLRPRSPGGHHQRAPSPSVSIISIRPLRPSAAGATARVRPHMCATCNLLIRGSSQVPVHLCTAVTPLVCTACIAPKSATRPLSRPPAAAAGSWHGVADGGADEDGGVEPGARVGETGRRSARCLRSVAQADLPAAARRSFSVPRSR